LAIYHFQMKTLSRSEGRSATAAAAYRSGQKIEDARTGKSFDYSQRSGVLLAEVITPDGGTLDRQQLWNAVESAEKRCNSVVAREFVVALPHELSREQQETLVKGYAQGLSERTGWAIDVAIHEPGKQGDLRNVHAHLLCSTRNVSRDPSGRPVMGSKTRDWDQRSSGSILIRSERSEWERCVNESLEQAQVQSRVDCRSHAEKQTGLEPQIHLGPNVTAMERQGIQTERGNIHREIARHNQNVVQFQKARAARIDEEFEQYAWKHELRQMSEWPLEKLQKAQAQYEPQSLEALLEKAETYRTAQETLSQLTSEREQILESLQQVEAKYAETGYQWNRFIVAHPWQSVLTDMGVLPVGGASKLKQTFQTIYEEKTKLQTELKRNETHTQEIQSKLDTYLEKALPEAQEAQDYQRERYQDLQALIQPKQAAKERAQLEIELQRWSGMSIPGLEQEARAFAGWTARRVALEKPEVQEAGLPLQQYPEHQRTKLKQGIQQAEEALKSAQRRIKQWKEAHPVQAFLCDKNMVYPSGEYAELLKVKVEKEYQEAQAKGHLKTYERGRAKAEEQLEKAIQKVLPECEPVAAYRQVRYQAVQLVLRPKQELERRREEEKVQQQRLERAKEQERSRGSGWSMGR